MSTGVKGFLYRGWQVRYAFDARRDCEVYEVSDPTRPQIPKKAFLTPREAMRFIDMMEAETCHATE